METGIQRIETEDWRLRQSEEPRLPWGVCRLSYLRHPWPGIICARLICNSITQAKRVDFGQLVLPHLRRLIHLDLPSPRSIMLICASVETVRVAVAAAASIDRSIDIDQSACPYNNMKI